MVRKVSWLLLFCIFFLSAACTSPATEGLTEDQILQHAERFMDLMTAQEYDQAREYFDPNLKKALTSERMKDNWHAMVQKYGIFLKLQDTRLEGYEDCHIAYISCLFEKQRVEARVFINQNGQITALFFTPVNLLPDVDMDAFREVEVSILSGEYELPGIVTLPASGSNFPGIVLVQNSTAKDRDATLGPNKMFRDLAWELADLGIATLRFDKRSLVYADTFINNYEYTIREETLDDAIEAVQFLRNHKEIDSQRIFILGHGLGGLISTRIVSEDDQMAGLILMAALARPVEEAILDQYEYLYNLAETEINNEKSLLEDVRRSIDTLKKIFAGEKRSPKTMILGAPITYWLDLHNLNPVDSLAGNPTIPVLVLQGRRDYQVTEADFRIWQNLLRRRNADFNIYDDLNHLFMPGEGKIVPAEYFKPNNVAQTVVNDIAQWVQSISGAEGE